jgi:hypothetical protein
MGAVIGIGVALAALLLFATTVWIPDERQPDKEEIQISNSHIWITTNGSSSLAGFVIQNSGTGTVSIHEIIVGGQSVPARSWYYNDDPAVVTAANIQREIAYDDTLDSIEVTGDASPEQFIQASEKISLMQGQAMFLYLANPAGITDVHSDSRFTVTIRTANSAAEDSVRVTEG